MIKLENIKADADQKHKIEFLEDEVNLRFRFYETVQDWYLCVNYNGVEIKGIRCAVGARLLKSNNFPFDLIIVDESQNGQDPFRLQDFDERMSVYIIEPDEIADIRGYKVEL